MATWLRKPADRHCHHRYDDSSNIIQIEIEFIYNLKQRTGFYDKRVFMLALKWKVIKGIKLR